MENIDVQINLLNQSIGWLETYHGNNISEINRLKNFRRKLKTIKFAIEERCSAAAYGESQAGKSYLMDSLLSQIGKPFSVDFGKEKPVFVDEINPSGGKNVKRESTGVITRFTTRCNNSMMTEYVKVRNFTIVDIILFLSDSYYKDIKIHPETALDLNDLNKEIEKTLNEVVDKNYNQNYITDDDIYDISDYFKQIVGSNAITIIQSEFALAVSRVISDIRLENWPRLFTLLWNKNKDITDLFTLLISELQKMSFQMDVYVPYQALLYKNGTLLDINWTDEILGDGEMARKYHCTTDVYDSTGMLLAKDIRKASLCALAAELTFTLSPDSIDNERMRFLSNIDLLDFPGSCPREKIYERDIEKEMSKLIRRGRVSYLFNKYSNAKRIGAILFCKDGGDGKDTEMGETLNNWIVDNIGETPRERSVFIKDAGGISPFFVVATKFNFELAHTNQKRGDNLNDKWDDRFKPLAEKVLKVCTYDWFNNWIVASEENVHMNSCYFRNIYLLRSFFWSINQNIFKEYKEGNDTKEKEVCPAEYPEYRVHLKESFKKYPFVIDHFSDPEQAWNDVASPNSDGSLAIIESLNKIAPQLDDARRKKYENEVDSIKCDVLDIISAHFVSDNPVEKLNAVKQKLGRIRCDIDVLFGKEPAIFGQLVKELMIYPIEIKDVVFKIIKNYTEMPPVSSVVANIRLSARIDFTNDWEERLKHLCEYSHKDVGEVAQWLSKHDLTIDDIIGSKKNNRGEDEREDMDTTQGGIISSKIYQYWMDHLMNEVALNLSSLLDCVDDIVNLLKDLFIRLKMKNRIMQITEQYLREYNDDMVSEVIADAVALTLNNFSRNFGRDYMDDNDLNYIETTAQRYSFDVDSHCDETTITSGGVADVLFDLENSANILKKQWVEDKEVNVLKRLPMYDNYWKWKNNLEMGLILVSDMPVGNPEANKSIQKIKEQYSNLM